MTLTIRPFPATRGPTQTANPRMPFIAPVPKFRGQETYQRSRPPSANVTRDDAMPSLLCRPRQYPTRVVVHFHQCLRHITRDGRPDTPKATGRALLQSFTHSTRGPRSSITSVIRCQAVVDGEHVHVLQADKQLAQARRIRLPRGTSI
jgi:hypothetical protein